MDIFITIAGNLGAGKSTLTKILAKRLGAEPVFEPYAKNPYLVKFYKDMDKWAFHCQMFFLSQRMKDHRLLCEKKGIIVQDRSIYEDMVFARSSYEQGFIKNDDWEVYQSLYCAFMDLLPAPDLVVYLKASLPTIKKRLKIRGRDFEQNIDEEYLASLNKIYDEWSSGLGRIPVLTVCVDDLNFEKNPKDLEYVVNLISQKLGGSPRKLPI